jgi:hypothetical protein
MFIDKIIAWWLCNNTKKTHLHLWFDLCFDAMNVVHMVIQYITIMLHIIPFRGAIQSSRVWVQDELIPTQCLSQVYLRREYTFSSNIIIIIIYLPHNTLPNASKFKRGFKFKLIFNIPQRWKTAATASSSPPSSSIVDREDENTRKYSSKYKYRTFNSKQIALFYGTCANVYLFSA